MSGVTRSQSPYLVSASVVLVYPRAAKYANDGFGSNVLANADQASTATCDNTRSFQSRKGSAD